MTTTTPITSHLEKRSSKVQSPHDNRRDSSDTISSEQFEQDRTVLPTAGEMSLSAPPRKGLVLSVEIASYLTGLRLDIILVALLLRTLPVAVDKTIIGVVIPKITTVFEVLTEVGYYGSAYLLTVTGFQPIFGIFYRLFQVKTVYLLSVLKFEVINQAKTIKGFNADVHIS